MAAPYRFGVSQRHRPKKRRSKSANRTNSARALLKQLLGQLEKDLAEQIADGLALPAWISLDRQGRQVVKNVLASDRREGPASDADLAQFVESAAPPEARFHGLVRIDDGLPRIIAWDGHGSLAVSASPHLRRHIVVGWDEQWTMALNSQPSGGQIQRAVEIDEESGAVLASLVAPSLKAEAEDLLTRLVGLAVEEVERRRSAGRR